MSQRNLLHGVLFLALIGAAIYLFTRSDPRQRTVPKVATAECICMSCKQRSATSYSVREIAPHICPKCQQPALYPLLYCQDCKRLFVPNLEHRAEDSLLRMPVIPACIACGSARTGQYIPGMPGVDPQGDPVLPKIP